MLVGEAHGSGLYTPHALTSDLAAVAARLQAITVALRTSAQAGGSGVIWRADGLVVTSAHVVPSADPGVGDPHGGRAGAYGGSARTHVVLADGRSLSATVVAWDRQLDLALLRIAAHDLPAAVVGDSERLRPGELVLAAGHPFGMAGAVVTGVVHATPGHAAPRWIQADLRLAPGNSGGPMADARGRVIGINAMIAGRLALAVPSHVVGGFLQRCTGP
jgi:serine protease Do